MAKLTPLAKGLIATVIVVGSGSLAWNLGIKDLINKPSGNSNQSTLHQYSLPKLFTDGAIGSKDNPLKVSLVSFHGYAPALVANGNALTTQAGSIYAQQDLNVKFVIQDDIPTLSTIFQSGAAQCAWRTSDFWAQEQPNLRNAGGDGRAVMIVDNTQGADAIITRNSSINAVEDLQDKTVAMLQFTPSHGMFIDAVENSSLSARKKASVKPIFINAEEGTAGVRATLEAGNVDAAVLWDPDLSLALRNINGSKVVYSTKTASNLIFDVMVCDQKVLATPEGEAAVQKFVSGWMAGVDAAKANPDQAVDALVKNEEFFTLLEKQEGKPFIKGLFDNLVWTGLADNARILGLAGTTNHYERVYQRFDSIYRKAGALANPNSPVINAQDSFDYRFIKQLLSQNRAATTQAAVPTTQFSTAEQQKALANGAAEVTKPVAVNFASGSFELSKRSQKVIDDEMVPFIENNGQAYFELSGNTDSIGATSANIALSEARAKAVQDYLVKQWEFPRERFKTAGNGSAKPLCNEMNPESEGLSIDDCRTSNRSTRIAVYGTK